MYQVLPFFYKNVHDFQLFFSQIEEVVISSGFKREFTKNSNDRVTKTLDLLVGSYPSLTVW